MTFDDAIVQWTNKYKDFDGAYGYQCMDLMHFYIRDCLGLQDPAVLAAPTAIDVWDHFSTITGHNFFDQIPNSATGIPQKGDIIFWGAPYGKYINNLGKIVYAGHVGMGTLSDISILRAFEQNNPDGSACHVQSHYDNYNGCRGWLRFKSAPIVNWEQKYNDLAYKMRQIRDIANSSGV